MSDPWTVSQLNNVIGSQLAHQRIFMSKLQRNTRRKIEDRSQVLEDRLGRQELLIRALAELCVRKGLLTHEELSDMINQMDLSDGIADGRIRKKPR